MDAFLHDKSILIVSPEPWDHIFVSKHHYAIRLAARNNRVFFLQPPGNRRLGIDATGYNNIWVISYTGFPRGLRFYPGIVRKAVLRKKFHAIQKAAATSFDIVWSFDNSVFFDFDALPGDVITISHIVDLNQHFQTRLAARSATFCLCTTELILNRLRKYNSRVYRIHHGCNVADIREDLRLPGRGKVKAVYAGNLGMPYLDWHPIHYTARENPDVDFIFIGPEGTNTERNIDGIHKLPNVYFPGKIGSNELQSLLAQADILMVCYKEVYQEEQANPHKMMEYLLSGKVIVTTHTAEFVECRDLLVMTERNSDWAAQFGLVRANLTQYNDEGLQRRRRAYALDNTYEKQIERIENVLLNG